MSPAAMQPSVPSRANMDTWLCVTSLSLSLLGRSGPSGVQAAWLLLHQLDDTRVSDTRRHCGLPALGRDPDALSPSESPVGREGCSLDLILSQWFRRPAHRGLGLSRWNLGVMCVRIAAVTVQLCVRFLVKPRIIYASDFSEA